MRHQSQQFWQRERLGVLLMLFLLPAAFFAVAYMFRADVTLDKPKFTEEFAKSVAALCISMLSTYFSHRRDHQKMEKQAQALFVLLHGQLCPQLPTLRMITDAAPLLFNNIPIERSRENNVKRQDFEQYVTLVSTAVKHAQERLFSADLEVTAFYRDYTVIIGRFSAASGAYFANPSDTTFTALKTTSADLFSLLQRDSVQGGRVRS